MSTNNRNSGPGDSGSDADSRTTGVLPTADPPKVAAAKNSNKGPDGKTEGNAQGKSKTSSTGQPNRDGAAFKASGDKPWANRSKR